MKRTLFALALAASLPISAQAREVNYNFVEAGYASSNVNTLDADFNGFNLDGSIGFNDSFYAFAGYKTGEDSGVDLNQTNIGLGWHSAGDVQWFVEGGWVNNEIDYGSLNTDDDGFGIATGVRGFIGENFEGNAKVSYVDVGDFGDGVGANLTGIYHFNDTWGAYASYDYSDRGDFDIDTWGLGVRASF